MRVILRHIPWLTPVLLVVFVAASSGFSVVLSHCTMCGDREDDACCCQGVAAAPGSGSGTGEATLAGSASACMVVTLAGGLQTEPTIVEKEPAFRTLVKSCVVPEAPDVPPSPCRAPSVATSLAASSRILPPAVEKYVLDRTFRI